MFTKSTMWSILKGMLVLALLAGCSATPTPVPTVDVQPTLQMVSTQAAQTVVANLTLNAPTNTPITPTSTNTVVPTDTLAPTATVGPTNTPAPSLTPTHAFIPWTLTPTATQAAFACQVNSVSPTTSTTIKVGQSFDGVWKLTNTGTKTWSKANDDVKFINGTNLQKTGKTLVDMTSNVAPEGTYTVTIDMVAPGTDGRYTSNWGLYLDDGTKCPLSLTIKVTK